MTVRPMRIIRTGVLAFAAVLMTVVLARAQVERAVEVVAGGGNTSSGNGITLRSTVGQAGTMAMSSQSMHVDGGFWPAVYIGEQSSTPIEQTQPDELPTDYALQPAYPNPFNPTTQIGYSLPEPAKVTLTVYNALGRRVATLVDTRQAAGQYDVRFRANGLSSGIYFYRLTAGSYQKVRAVTLVE